MIVLSLFDGMSCGMLALKRAGIQVDSYFASEIDKYAVQVSKKNWSEIVHIGDVTQVKYKDGVLQTQFGSYKTKIDMVIGGSPCTSFSVAGDGSGFNGESGLFFEYLRILREVNPKYFLLENVVMKKQWEEVINNELGVKPIMINSALVSAQNRKRLYWTNIDGITQPQDKGVLLKDVVKKPVFVTPPSYLLGEYCGRQRLSIVNEYIGKSACLTASMYKGQRPSYIKQDNLVHKLTPIECERLQTLPDNYTDGVSNSQRYKMIGNGWTVDVIAHIFSFIGK